MKNFSHAVTAKHVNHRITVFVSIFGNHITDIAEMGSRFNHINAPHHAFISHVAQTGCLQLGLSGIIHTAGVAVPAVNNRRHINIQNIAVGQLTIRPRNTVTNDMVYRNAG